MRELIYLSDVKLKQFVPEGRRRSRIGRRLTALKLNASTAVGGAGLEVDLGGEQGFDNQSIERLDGVVRYVEEHALWYQDPTARAGRWVYFEAPLLSFIGKGRADVGTVFFVDPPYGRVRGHDQPEGIRLLLHGSETHLLAAGMANIDLTLDGVLGSHYDYTFPAFRDSTIPPVADEIIDGEAAIIPEEVVPTHQLEDLTCSPFSSVPPTLPWMRGYARVSTVRHVAVEDQNYPLVVATPLYVEYAHDLPD